MKDLYIKRLFREQAAAGAGKTEDGFSLVELLVVLAIFSVLMTGVMSVLVNFTRSYTFQEVATEIQQDVRMAMFFMERDLRTAGLYKDGQTSEDSGFQVALGTQVKFTADNNLNGDIDASDFEEISYVWVGTTLKQRLYSGASLSEVDLLDDVALCTFTYFDEDGNTTSDTDEVRTVRVSLTVRRQGGAMGKEIERDYQMRVKCRNMGV